MIHDLDVVGISVSCIVHVKSNGKRASIKRHTLPSNYHIWSVAGTDIVYCDRNYVFIIISYHIVCYNSDIMRTILYLVCVPEEAPVEGFPLRGRADTSVHMFIVNVKLDSVHAPCVSCPRGDNRCF